MSLSVGDRIAHYDVTVLIGEGSMGQVYQATDTKLNRQAALKILPEAFAADPDRLARFQREAQVLASLNHPGIAAIYGIEEQDGTRALVLELVEGPTLADRIGKGPIPIDEALPIAKQIAEALEAAHEAGGIHRDLKPANIKVREDGTVKVLDLGLAKALDSKPTGDPSEFPTLTASATRMGVIVIMGTAAYMSPEQASGSAVDKRADIWSFGVVLFEMLTGKRVFDGATVSHVLAAVLKTEPDWTTLPTETPNAIRKLLRHSLAKERRGRVPDISVARIEIDDLTNSAMADPVDVLKGPPRRAMSFGVTVLGSAAVGGLAVWLLLTPDAVTSPTPTRFDITPSSETPLRASEFEPSVAITPDGKRVLYRVGIGGPPQMVVRSLAELEATPLVQGSRHMFVSPDGNSVGYFTGGLFRVPIQGGPPTKVFDPAISTHRHIAQAFEVFL